MKSVTVIVLNADGLGGKAAFWLLTNQKYFDSNDSILETFILIFKYNLKA